MSDETQGRLFDENDDDSGAVDPALVSDWPEIEAQFGWLADLAGSCHDHP